MSQLYTAAPGEAAIGRTDTNSQGIDSFPSSEWIFLLCTPEQPVYPGLWRNVLSPLHLKKAEWTFFLEALKVHITPSD